MNKFFLVLLSCLFAASVLAQSPDAKRAVEFCEARYPGTGASARLQQLLCIQDQNIKILEARLLKGEGTVGAELARLRRELDATKAELARTRTGGVDARTPDGHQHPSPENRAEIERRLAEIRGRVGNQPTIRKDSPPTPAPAPVPVIRQPAAPIGPVGPRHMVVPTPGRFIASTFDPSGPRLELFGLALGVQQHAWGADQVRVLIKRNGIPIPIAHDVNGKWNEIYADLNGDGKPERMPLMVVDPHTVDSIYISHVDHRTVIDVVYFVPTGKLVLVPGYPPQILWGSPVRVRLDRVPRLGRWHVPAVTGRKL